MKLSKREKVLKYLDEEIKHALDGSAYASAWQENHIKNVCRAKWRMLKDIRSLILIEKYGPDSPEEKR
jgi:hypothetical protein